MSFRLDITRKQALDQILSLVDYGTDFVYSLHVLICAICEPANNELAHLLSLGKRLLSFILHEGRLAFRRWAAKRMDEQSEKESIFANRIVEALGCLEPTIDDARIAQVPKPQAKGEIPANEHSDERICGGNELIDREDRV